jgi:HEAT repeat protein
MKRARLIRSLATLGAALGLACQAAPENKPAVEASVQTPAFAAGELSVYRVALSSQIDLPGAEQRRVDVDLSGELELVARDWSRGTGLVSARFLRPSLKTLDPDTQQELESVKAALEKPVLLKFAQGRLEEVRVPANYPQLASNLQRTVGSSLQFAPGCTGEGAGCEAEEEDAAGKYRASYARGAAPGSFQKTKSSYGPATTKPLPGLQMQPLNVAPRVVSASCNIAVSNMRFQSVGCEEKLTLEFTPGSPIVSQTKLSLARVRSAQAAPVPDFGALLATTSNATAPLLNPRASTRLGVDEERIRNLDFPRALAALEAQEKDPEKDKVWGSVNGKKIDEEELERREDRVLERTDAFVAMVALLRLRTADVPLAVAAVERKSIASARLFSALSSAGTPEAQAALVKLMQNPRLPDEARLAAAARLIRTPAATPATVNVLTSLVEDPLLATHAVYGLGTISRRLREAGDLERASTIGAVLVSRLERAKTTDSTVRALRGIANSGYVPALATVRSRLDAENEDVRGAALEALRHMADPAVDGILAERIRSDKSPSVRLAAINAFKLREPSAVLALPLAQTSEHDADPRVRRAAVRLAGIWISRRPELRTVLDRIRTSDESATVRAIAQAQLGAPAP